MNELNFFNTYNDYILAKTNNSDMFKSTKNVVSYCNYENKVYYDSFYCNRFDILYSDANGNLSVSNQVLSTIHGKTPIALCVAETNFFGTNEPARWMSLKYLDDTSDNGGNLNPVRIILGGSPYLYNLADYNITNTLYKNENTVNYDSDVTPYYLNASDHPGKNGTPGNPQIPSLFTNDNKWNIAELGAKNAYAITKVNGRYVADTLYEYYNGVLSVGAVKAARKYITLGTENGDWYVPALGELAMIMAQLSTINNKLLQINTVYPNDCISAISTSQHMSCTTYPDYANWVWWRISPNSAKIFTYSDKYYAFAMMQY